MLLIILLITLSGATFSQHGKVHQTVLPFKYLDRELIQEVERTIDLDWGNLSNAQRLELKLLSTRERLLSQKDQQKLSKERADSVYPYLLLKGIPEEQISLKLTNFEDCTVGFCQASEPTRVLRRSKGYYSLILHKPAYWKDNEEEPDYNFLESNCQEFWITNMKDCKIKGKKGTEVLFRAGSFDLDYKGLNPPETRVKITLCEFYTREDFVLANLTTTSNGKLLVSGGTIYIKAEHMGNQIDLFEGEQIEIMFLPMDSLRFYDGNEMETFIGEYSDGEVNWVPEEDNVYFTGGEFIDGIVDQSPGSPRQSEVVPYNFNDVADGLIDQQVPEWSVDGYLMSSAQLGWINCDAFYDYESMQDLLVQNDRGFPLTYRLIFKKINSVMGGDYSGTGKGYFRNVPTGQEATVIGYANTTDGRVAVSKKQIIINEKNHIYLEVEIMEAALFKEKIKEWF